MTTNTMSAVDNNEAIVKSTESGLDLSSMRQQILSLRSPSAAAPNICPFGDRR